MKKTKKILSLVMVVLMLVSCVSMGKAQAATTISYAPNPKVEYGYSSGVTTGTIRYISQINGSAYFNSNYWGNWAGQAGIECGTASISMALSYVGVNKTPKAILDAHSGTTYFTGWGPTTSNPSVANGMNNYINGNGKYSPPIVHFTTGYASGSHYVILIGKVSSSSYLVLDPASNNTWTLSTSDAKYKSINQVFQYYNPNASINNDTQKPGISNVKVTDINSYGFTISCNVSDNVGIKQVLFPVWTTENGQDDIIYHKATLSGNTATCRINVTDHKNSYGEYVCDPHIYDTSDNLLISGRVHIQVPKIVANSEQLAPLGTYDISKNSTVQVSGWAFNKTGAKVVCYYQIDKGKEIKLENRKRQDVVDYHKICQQLDCGYRDYISILDLGEGKHTIKIIAKTDNAYELLFTKEFTVVIPNLIINFNVNNGQCSTASKTAKFGSTYGTLPTPTRDGYTFDGWYTSATGGTKVTSSTKVTATSNHTLYAHWTCNHSSTEIKNTKTATCTAVGFTGDTYCITCSAKLKSGSEIDKLSHSDTNSDYKCDYGCGYEFEKPEPETPSTDCSCNCHKGGIVGFFFKIINFFEKLFGKNKVCACGAKH